MRARAAAALALALSAMGCAPPSSSLQRPRTASDGRYVMGTLLEITLNDLDASTASAALEELFAVAIRLDALMTVFDPESQISRLNRAAGKGPQPVDPAVVELLAQVVEYAKQSRGSFDVTVGPLVDVWSAAAVAGVPPTAAALARARARVGSDQIRIHSDGRVELTREGVSVNLGGVAKGFALDRMLPLLRARGVRSALLDFGQSSVLALGAPPGAEGWRLLVRGPGGNGGFLGVLTLVDQALSVSSSLSQGVEIAGRLYGHVIDPRNGRPLTRRLQALVVAQHAAHAEALSKALLILPPREGLALIAAEARCEGMLVSGDGRAWMTPGWERAVRWAPRIAASDSSGGGVAPIEDAWRPRS